MENSRVSLRPDLHDFPSSGFGTLKELISPLDSREKDTLIVACSELGTAFDQISFADRERFVVLQHLAASIPSRTDCDIHDGLSCDSIRELFDKHDFRHLIVCGHFGSRVIPYWLQHERGDVDSDTGFFRQRFESGARDLVDINYFPDSRSERLELVILEHVLCQIANLLTHAFVAKRVQNGKLFLYGWVVENATARVYNYRVAESAFVLI